MFRFHHSRLQSLRSFWPAAGIESSGSNHFEITMEITEFCPSGLTQSSSMARARNGCSQSSRLLPQARRGRECAFTKSTRRFLRFFASRRSSLNKIGTTWSVTPPVSLLSCYIPLQCTWLAIFRASCSAFPTKTSKYGNYRIIVFSNWRHIRPSTHAPLNSVANQTGGNLKHFEGA